MKQQAATGDHAYESEIEPEYKLEHQQQKVNFTDCFYFKAYILYLQILSFDL